LRDNESEATIIVPLIVGIVIVRVQPATIVIAVRIEEVRIAI